LPGTIAGAARRFAVRLGLAVEEVEARRQAGERWCSRCRQWKPLAEFHSNPSRRLAASGYCGECFAGWTKEHGVDSAARVRRYRDNPTNVGKELARQAVRTALRTGGLNKGPCEIGGDCSGRIEAHHDDYSKPLEVRWLCRRHHGRSHRAAAPDLSSALTTADMIELLRGRA
jgi:hypothetical protein